MLVDVELNADVGLGGVGMVLRLIAAQNEGGPRRPLRIGAGLYLLGHWNLDAEVAIPPRLLEHYPNIAIPAYGVCDSPEQFLEYIGSKLSDPKRKFFVGLVCMRKADQPPSGGWRWHKWGEYIGAQKPTCEHLRDEPVIEEVYTYHVYEILEECSVEGVDKN